jgi:hypothetical protein
VASVPAIFSELNRDASRSSVLESACEGVPTRGGLSSRLRRLTAAEIFWLAFVTVQALDGALSYIGVSLHGPDIEGNPLVAWGVSAFGPAAGFMAAKLFAVSCGLVLYLTARHKWVAILTLVYVIFAVGPWAHLLSSSI